MSDMEKAMSQMLADMTPKKLPTNEEIFGKGAQLGDAKAMGFTDILDSMTPKKLPTNEEIFGQLAELDTTAFDALLDLFRPKKLMSYDELGKMVGMKF
ncbi:hypothetical protein GQF56_03765 [Rhodobacter sphaeroides]|jgi:hypothetical protein|uniref:Uncharacterized protein n=2 Tax=Cereibacter sphaeroides TaxID=1063 RepID=Q3J036_CERS4|nr:hypothetical protein [Cereibacter sphaeroides]ABN77429.1 hypothetical protein Rsph17029_2327 [Cereibacter sphaeroides ATCC 17029]EKX59473.1 hypothetical protein D516_2628 [Rhodobacter sp. AKP1]ABA79848.2 hypothetical protein RSP_6124 [Cereibacter sphaeroides 2.4.1]AMJ48121.1 hypothetical protein APX01_11390 [Cereibacter sphaeroides]ANS34831.1 hypothetical protein A3858_11415 [Cereibacter sphaeroides]